MHTWGCLWFVGLESCTLHLLSNHRIPLRLGTSFASTSKTFIRPSGCASSFNNWWINEIKVHNMANSEADEEVVSLFWRHSYILNRGLNYIFQVITSSWWCVLDLHFYVKIALFAVKMVVEWIIYRASLSNFFLSHFYDSHCALRSPCLRWKAIPRRLRVQKKLPVTQENPATTFWRTLKRDGCFCVAWKCKCDRRKYLRIVKVEKCWSNLNKREEEEAVNQCAMCLWRTQSNVDGRQQTRIKCKAGE